jgi:hypothetical protein
MNTAQLLTNAQVRQLGLRAGAAKVTDLLTSRSYNICWGGSPGAHTDFSPLTPQDTETMRSIAGGNWNWTARPAILEIGGRRLAVGVHSFPHGSVICGNPGLPNMSNSRPGSGWPIGGHMCMWYKDSRSNNGTESQYSRDMRAAAQRAFEMSGGGSSVINRNVNFTLNGVSVPAQDMEGVIIPDQLGDDRTFAAVGQIIDLISNALGVTINREWIHATRTVAITATQQNNTTNLLLARVLASATAEQWQRIARILEE